RILCGLEVDEMDDVPWLREIGAALLEVLDRERVRFDPGRREAGGAEAVEKAHQAFCSARSRSAQRCARSSRPTDSRRRPAGTRSPSQRALASIREATPPKLVMFATSVVDVSTRRAASASATSKVRSPPNPG